MDWLRILYIDDEEHNLQAFKASFRRQYEIFTAVSAKDAQIFLEQRPGIHIIISDQRMPDITGVEFFKIIKYSYPDAIRILLTGYTDIDTLAEAVNDGHIYRYITKPWNELEMNNSITNAYDAYKNRIALKEKVEELQKTNDQLNRFIYSISHELRAPLASALGAIQLARMENVIETNTRAAEYWQMVEDCCDKLDYNITSTLQYYKNNRSIATNEKIDFNKTISSLIDIHKRANNIIDNIDFNITIRQNNDFYGDLFRIEVILGNLISNAIKYQKPEANNKKVDIDINVTETGDLQASIADNGIGISEADCEKIFTQFFRGNYGNGVGLGLFIVKEALDKINATISVRSDFNNGSIFTLWIPGSKNHLPNI